MKIAITVRFRSEAWLGGENYFFSLIEALRNNSQAGEHEIFVLTNRPELLGEKKKNGVEIVSAPWLETKSSIPNLINGALASYASFNPRLFQFAKSVAADLITHTPALRFSPCHTLFWMPDFQHCHYPEYFTSNERKLRNSSIAATTRTGHILLSSHSAASDFRKYYPELSHVATHVLQFTPYFNEFELTTKVQAQLRAKYLLPERFFFLPNQFWLHKNHLVVIEALRLLPENYRVVCTGSQDDYRFREHTQNIRELLEKYALQDRFKMLGVIDRTDMIALMRMSICVINPSLFEGWSTTVEEAKYMGKRIIVSDIAVHKEQNPDEAIFFNPHDVNALAESMKMAMEQFTPETEALRKARAKEKHQKSIVQFGARYLEIAHDIIYA